MTRIIPEFRTQDNAVANELERQVRVLEEHFSLKTMEAGQENGMLARTHAYVWTDSEHAVHLYFPGQEAIYRRMVVSSRSSIENKVPSQSETSIETIGDCLYLEINSVHYRIHFNKPPEDQSKDTELQEFNHGIPVVKRHHRRH